MNAPLGRACRAIMAITALAGVLVSWHRPVHAADAALTEAELDTPGVAAGLAPANPAVGTRLPLVDFGERPRWVPLLYGGSGVYVDDQPFFGRRDAFVGTSPIARPSGATRRASVAEISLEPGLGFTAPLGGPGWTAFGAATVAATATVGADIYRRDSHVEIAVEKAFVGLLRRFDNSPTLLMRVGRSGLTLDDGFLVHLVRTSSNAGDRRALNLGARSAADLAVSADLRSVRWRAQLFALDPDELPVVDSRSRFAGGQLAWQPVETIDLAISHLQVLRSDSLLRRPGNTALAREGLRATTIQARWRNALDAQGLLLAALLGEQQHRSDEVRARAGYLRVAYRWNDAPGRPAAELRHARFSGDRPETTRYERWDPLLAAGSDEWMGGIAFSKFQSNTNLRQDRLRLFTSPSDGMALTLDWLRYRADQSNNLGAGPLGAVWPSRDLGHELMAILRWNIGSRLYAQAVASVNRPGPGVQLLAGGKTQSWVTLQASLYWFVQ